MDNSDGENEGQGWAGANSVMEDSDESPCSLRKRLQGLERAAMLLLQERPKAKQVGARFRGTSLTRALNRKSENRKRGKHSETTGTAEGEDDGGEPCNACSRM
jgi:hypothetical protein